MRVYFLSCIPAILKLNGMYIGAIDGFERHIELDPKDRVFAEIIPDENLHGINFFLDEKFFKSPPSFCDLYLLEGDALIYIREYAEKDAKIEVLHQTRFCGNLITIFAQAGLYLSIDGVEYSLTPLPSSFRKFTAETYTLAGREVFAISNGRHLIIISDRGKIVFKSPADSFEISDVLKITAGFETCTAASAECEYSYDGENLKLISAKTSELRPPEPEILHFAFFESVLTSADFEKYLCADLKEKAGSLRSYLGDFVSVTVPPEKFYIIHGDIKAAGLVYPKSENLYEIKYFAVDCADGVITNIYPIE
ncbi:MAG: hypothetical protein K2N23_01485 [Clostridia bacterium]|nr:hypothetical protein [Clostridia bacterium]